MNENTCACTRVRSCLLCKKKELYEPTHIHSEMESEVSGLFILHDIITLYEEQLLVSYFDKGAFDTLGSMYDYPSIKPEDVLLAMNAPGWVESQSGRRKQDFGPKINFMKRKIKLGDECKPVPSFLRPLLNKIAISHTYPTDGFHAIEMVALDYNAERGSHIEPHLDDIWAWGPRIVGINLLSESHMIFTRKNEEGGEYNVKVQIPARSAYIMSGDSRFKWSHAIAWNMITSRRVSLTFRELSRDIAEEEPEICRKLVALNDR